ncbi:MAG: GWxTD domain-containing protein [Bacteroidota bacterium]|nr:GWxTD domain-containing protein [Bacteroidota bacterium]
MKTLLKYSALIFLILSLKTARSIDVYYKLASFNIPKAGPFIETYMTIAGQSVQYKAVKGGFQSAVNVSIIITDATNKIVQAKKYNLNGPIFNDTTNIPAFIDTQRYPLASGAYTIEVTVNDNNKKQVPFKLMQVFKINYGSYPIQASSIQLLESYKKTTTPSLLSKSGYDLIPYNINYYPEAQSKLAFYFETYNTDTFFGKGKTLIYKYFIENNDNLKPVEPFSAFKKVITAPVNPLLAQIDITNLASGNYNLVIEIRDEKNIIQLQEKMFFQRKNTLVPQTYVSGNYAVNSVEQYFSNVKSVDTLKIYVECLWPISNMIERERQINQTLKNDTAVLRNYLIKYWKDRAADSVNPMKIWMEYLTSVNEVAALFKCGKQKGYFTDRGRVYLQYGKPNQRVVQANEPSTYPYEIWQYYRLTDKTNGQFFTNRKFLFVNKSVADDCFKLEHSDMKGEVNNPRWRYEVMKRQTDGIHDPDNESPGTSGSQMDDLFNNPR